MLHDFLMFGRRLLLVGHHHAHHQIQPTGQGSNATMLSKPLPTASYEPKVKPRKGIADKTRSAAAQHMAIMSIPLSVVFFCAGAVSGASTVTLLYKPIRAAGRRRCYVRYISGDMT
jgi:hypothetical protein